MLIGRAALTARRLDNREAIVAIGAAWNAVSKIGARGISATSVWYEAWIDAFGETVAPRVIAVSDETGALRGVLPLAVLSRQLGGLRARVLEMGAESVACSDHLGLVATAPDDAVWTAALLLQRTLERDTDVVYLWLLTVTTSPGRVLGSLAPFGWRAAPTIGTVAPRLALNGSAAAFEQSLSANRRHQALGEAHPGHAFVWEGERSYYTSGWNPAFAECLVGELLLAHVRRTAADEGVSSFDLGRGADAYKSRFATEPVSLLAAKWSTNALGHLAVGVHRFALRATREWNRRRTRLSRRVDARRLPTGVPSE